MNRTEFADCVFACGVRIDFAGVTEFEDFDESKSHDGGSYYQPTHEISWSVLGGTYTLTIEDTSCGDFGARVYATLDKNGSRVCAANYGSLAGEEYTDFDDSDFDCSVALAIAACIGYQIPYTNKEA